MAQTPAPSIPVLALGGDTGRSDTDGITDIGTPTLSGTAAPGAAITLYDSDGVTPLRPQRHRRRQRVLVDRRGRRAGRRLPRDHRRRDPPRPGAEREIAAAGRRDRHGAARSADRARPAGGAGHRDVGDGRRHLQAGAAAHRPHRAERDHHALQLGRRAAAVDGGALLGVAGLHDGGGRRQLHADLRGAPRRVVQPRGHRDRRGRQRGQAVPARPRSPSTARRRRPRLRRRSRPGPTRACRTATG